MLTWATSANCFGVSRQKGLTVKGNADTVKTGDSGVFIRIAKIEVEGIYRATSEPIISFGEIKDIDCGENGIYVELSEDQWKDHLRMGLEYTGSYVVPTFYDDGTTSAGFYISLNAAHKYYVEWVKDE